MWRCKKSPLNSTCPLVAARRPISNCMLVPLISVLSNVAHGWYGMVWHGMVGVCGGVAGGRSAQVLVRIRTASLSKCCRWEYFGQVNFSTLDLFIVLTFSSVQFLLFQLIAVLQLKVLENALRNMKGILYPTCWLCIFWPSIEHVL